MPNNLITANGDQFPAVWHVGTDSEEEIPWDSSNEINSLDLLNVWTFSAADYAAQVGGTGT